MVSIPRIITVDSTWTIARIIRSAIDLTDRTVVQVDVPDAEEALEELARNQYQVLVTTYRMAGNMKGVELALMASKKSPDTAIIILADFDDLEKLDDDMAEQSPFIYLSRPVDVHQFMRVLFAAVDGEDVFAAYNGGQQSATVDLEHMGAIPSLDVNVARATIDSLLRDVGAMAVALSTRMGELLVEVGAVGYLDRERMTNALLPTMLANVSMSGMVGGKPQSLHFFDGDDYDVYVLSVGYHHFISLVFDGQSGQRQFGAVTRFGRRAAEDLKALLGASAYTLEKKKATGELRRRTAKPEPEEQEEEFEVLEKAEKWDNGDEDVAAQRAEEQQLKLDPIENFDPSIFDTAAADDASADDLFDPDKLEELANELQKKRDEITYEEAVQLGMIKG